MYSTKALGLLPSGPNRFIINNLVIIRLCIAHRASHRYRGGHGSNPVEASDFFLGFVCNCLSYFTTARITFTSILYPQTSSLNIWSLSWYKLHIFLYTAVPSILVTPSINFELVDELLLFLLVSLLFVGIAQCRYCFSCWWCCLLLLLPLLLAPVSDCFSVGAHTIFES